ncbi:hypothetical protein KEM48_010220 [Puccinia striiformis f. sp. tritici PST-130]|nr:hypothetical protein KEM48_010220 [Puccinia striiformis f. sp. tritici PST-130]
MQSSLNVIEDSFKIALACYCFYQIGPTLLVCDLKLTYWTNRSTLPSKVNLMDNDIESILTDLSSEYALSANDKDYPSTSELSEPPELNPISNIEHDTELLLTELSSQPALLVTPEDYDSDFTDSSDSSEEDVPLSSYLGLNKGAQSTLMSTHNKILKTMIPTPLIHQNHLKKIYH